MRHLLFGLLLALLLPTLLLNCPVVAQPATDAEIAAFVDGSLAGAVDQLGLPGAAVVVVRNGRPILQKAYGFAELESQRRADPQVTLYRQASISKLFTWILVMQQVEAGKLDLDTDVNRYIAFQIPQTFGRPITLRHLMTHSAGFTERLRGIFDDGPPAPLEELLRANIPASVYPPGQRVAYSNYGAALAAHIVERSAGKPFAPLVQERILDPLHMRRSSFAQPLPPTLAADLASGYLPGSRTAVPFEWVAPTSAGGMSATAADMGRFLAMLANGGTLDGVHILRPESLQMMLTLAQPLAPGLPDGIGLGFIGGLRQGVRQMGHGGNLAGAATQLTLFPDAGLGLYVAFNGQGNANAATRVRRDLLDGLARRFAGGAAQPSPVAVGDGTADDVAGVYLSARRHHRGFLTFGDMVDPTVVVAQEDGSITLSTVTRSDGSLRRWIPVARDRFAEQESASPLVFERGPEGKVSGMAGELAYPVAAFDRAENWLAKAPFALAAALAVMAITVLAVPVYAMTHRSHALPMQGRRRPARTFVPARIGALALLACFGLWAHYFTSAEANLALYTTRADGWLLALRIVTGIAVVGGLFLLLDAIAALGDASRTVWRKIWAAIAGVAAAVLLAIIFRFDLLLFSTSY